MSFIRTMMTRSAQIKSRWPTSWLFPEPEVLPVLPSEPLPFDQVPGPRGPPILHMLQYLPFIGRYKKERMNDALLDLTERYGPIVRTDFVGGVKCVQLFNPEDIAVMFRHEGRYPTRPLAFSLRKLRDSRQDLFKTVGMSLMNGPKWQELRSRVQDHMIRPASVETHLEAMEEVGNEFVDLVIKHCRGGRNEFPCFLEPLYEWAMESIWTVMFGKRLGLLSPTLSCTSSTWQGRQLLKTVKGFVETINKLEYGLRLWRYFRIPSYRRLEKDQELLVREARKHLNDVRKGMSSGSNCPKVPSLLHSFLANGIDIDELVVLVTDAICAGVDTTANTFGMTLYHLAKNEDAQNRLRAEILLQMPDKSTTITKEILKNLPYLKACIRESMRLSPVVMGTARILDHEVVLSGYKIPPGVLILARSQTASVLEANFDDPNIFKPERWLRNNEGVRTFHAYTCQPFGVGPRMCVGRRIAEQEMYILLAKMVQRFKVEYHYCDIGQYTSIMNKPDKPLRLRFIEL